MAAVRLARQRGVQVGLVGKRPGDHAPHRRPRRALRSGVAFVAFVAGVALVTLRALFAGVAFRSGFALRALFALRAVRHRVIVMAPVIEGDAVRIREPRASGLRDGSDPVPRGTLRPLRSRVALRPLCAVCAVRYRV